jgi:hypothetical protein
MERDSAVIFMLYCQMDGKAHVGFSGGDGMTRRIQKMSGNIHYITGLRLGLVFLPFLATEMEKEV